MSRAAPPAVLSIAGSDPSGGAGIQADLKAFSALGAYGMAVITALTAQSTRGVTGVHVVPVEFVREQLDTLLDDITPRATKVGMLATADHAALVAEYAPRLDHTVLDPVMVATSGDRLLDERAVDAVRTACEVVDLITPNLPEAAVLLGTDPARSLDELEEQAVALRDAGVRRVLLKGGHLDTGDGLATDVYADADGVLRLSAARVATSNTHGTGCTLSSAIAALRPVRPDWASAVRDAKAYLGDALAAADSLGVGHGSGPVHHFANRRRAER